MSMAVERMPALATAKPLSSSQFWFIAGVYYALPDTPQALPHGDHALLAQDNGPSVVFFDGEMACERMRLSAPSAQALEDVGASKFNHAGEEN